jgi:hypothetical protein
MSITQLPYGVRQFTLEGSRDNEQLRFNSENITVLECDSQATLRLESVEAPEIPLQSVERIQVPDNVTEAFLSHPPGDVNDSLTLALGNDGIAFDPTGRGEPEYLKASTSLNGSSNAVELPLITPRDKSGPKEFEVSVETSGAATLTVEVATTLNSDPAFFTELATKSYSSATQEIIKYETSAPHIRAYLDQNTTLLEAYARKI